MSRQRNSMLVIALAAWCIVSILALAADTRVSGTVSLPEPGIPGDRQTR